MRAPRESIVSIVETGGSNRYAMGAGCLPLATNL
jgi:hypothetical protein